MYLKINEQTIHYKVFSTNVNDVAIENIVFLPGWGCNIEHYSKILHHLAEKFKVYALDLPGFGLSFHPHVQWSSKNYAEIVAAFIQILQIKNLILIGHSFGGKIAIYLVANKIVRTKKLILLSSAGIKSPRTLFKLAKICIYKLFKNIVALPFLKNILASKLKAYRKKHGSEDYNNVNGAMRDTLVKLVNEDFRFLLPKINIPTFLIWGDRDSSTPLSSGQLMQKLLINAKLAILRNCGHHAFLDDWEKFSAVLEEFLAI